ncbi:group II intron maturase-specific domain-containing protein [Paraburkholderia heleia]|uniref:group II intron maturase-specific domain-containing protein n=1 Tax=Paraburkholderia heleia TaxID=634127 RepID=UPI000694195F|nr:group II intron maturase-specific domain-containing protein [Paraburkholderia heleia]
MIKPSKKNIKAFLHKFREIVKSNKTLRQDKLIRWLNPIVYGQANYHRHVVAKHIFRKVNHKIRQTLWRWAVRRHPKKNAGWIRKKYFRTQGHRHWVFGVKAGKVLSTGKPELLTLYEISLVTIRRHVQSMLRSIHSIPIGNSILRYGFATRCWTHLKVEVN